MTNKDVKLANTGVACALAEADVWLDDDEHKQALIAIADDAAQTTDPYSAAYDRAADYIGENL